MSRSWRALSMIAALGLAGYFLWYAASRFDLATAGDALRRPEVLVATFLAIAGYVLIYPFTGAAWSVLLRRQAVYRSTGELTQLLSFTQVSRYVPGNVAQHVSRALLGIRRGIPPRAYVVCILQETGLTVCASVVTGAVMLAVSGAPLAKGGLAVHWLVYFSAMVCAACVLLACLDIRPGGERRSGLWRRLVEWSGGTPGFRATCQAMPYYIGNYLVVGTGLWMIARALGIGHEVGFALATAVFSLSWILGFLVPGAPAGLGAREGLMVLMLQGHGADEQVLLLTLLVRVVSIAGDALAFLASLCFMGGTTRSGGDAA